MSYDRYWLLTWTTYGSWLPGDERGCVTSVRHQPGKRRRYNLPGTPVEPPMSGLQRSAERLMAGNEVRLQLDQATAIFDQFQETANIRGWQLVAVAIMANHIHVELGVPGDPEPDAILRDLKAYASRALNRKWNRPARGTWWTESGSKRRLKDELAILGAAKYVRDQEFPLVVWVHPDFAKELPDRVTASIASGADAGSNASPIASGG